MKLATKITLGILCSVFILLAVFFAFYFAVTASTTLDHEKLLSPNATVHVYDKFGTEMGDLSAKGKRVTEYESIPEDLKNAFIAVEDKRFYSHHGIDYVRVVKAGLKNLSTFSFREGASTISQQLIKNTHLSGEKTLSRKLKEYKLAKQLEREYTKDEIMALYLNSIYFGHNAFGVTNASEFYFGKKVSELDLSECALLTALVKSPNRYSPFKHPEKCLSRRNFVLDTMLKGGFINESRCMSAKNASLPTKTHKQNNAYLSLVLDELESIDDVDYYDLHVFTYFDKDVQAILENIETPTDQSIIIRDNKHSSVVAFKSSVGEIKRQPASTIKPLAVFAPTFEEKIASPATPILDEKVNFSGYEPKNYSDSFSGFMSVRTALSKSVNIPAVKLLNSLGVEKSASYLEKVGISVHEKDKNLALSLGGMTEGVSLRNLLDAYSVFANGGVFKPSHTIKLVKSADGKVIFEEKNEGKRVYSPSTVSLINDVLLETVSSGTAKKLRTLPFPVYAKTGTSGSQGKNTDAYCMAYTQSHTLGVWLGNKDNSPVSFTGGGLPTEIANEILCNLCKNEKPSYLPVEGIKKVKLDKFDYEENHRLTLADPLAPPSETIEEVFSEENTPTAVNTRFSMPTIQKPNLSVQNGGILVQLCLTQYYDYIIKRQQKDKIEVIYEGKYVPSFFDNSVESGEIYTYSVTPVYQGNEGATVTLPSIKIEKSLISEKWWDD